MLELTIIRKIPKWHKRPSMALQIVLEQNAKNHSAYSVLLRCHGETGSERRQESSHVLLLCR